MLSPLDSGHSRHRVCMVRRPYHNRVDLIFHLIEHLAEITEHLRLRKLLDCRGALQVNVAQSHDIITA